MRKRMISTIADFVDEMGGTGATAAWLGVGDSYVSNMLARGYLPPGYHMRALIEINRRGLDVDPAFFELQGEDGEVLQTLLRPLGARRRQKTDVLPA